MTTLRELLEMRCLWHEDGSLDNAELRSLLGSEPHTALERAVEETLVGLRCLAADGVHARGLRPARIDPARAATTR